VTQNAKKSIAVLALTLLIIGHCRRNVFIDHLGEPGYLGCPDIKTTRIAFTPEAQDASTQRAIFVDNLGQVKTRFDSKPYVSGGSMVDWSSRGYPRGC